MKKLFFAKSHISFNHLIFALSVVVCVLFISCKTSKDVSTTEDEIVDIPTESVSNNDEENPVYFICEVMPVFPGGDNALRNFISTNIIYPKEAQNKRQEGKAYISFVIHNDGSITDIKIARSTGYKLLDQEAMRVLEEMPMWKPGMQRGKQVRVSYTIPVNFTLSDKNHRS